MTNADIQNSGEVLKAYADYESQLTGRHLRIGCFLVMTLMPAGVVLDYFVYPEELGHFFLLRLASVIVAGMVWAFLRSPVSQRFHRALGLFIALLPVFFICWMIYAAPADQGGAAGSPYYAGLNLSLLAIAFVMRWSVDLSILASVMVLGMYLAACLLRGPLPAEQQGIFFNNLYFLALTSIMVRFCILVVVERISIPVVALEDVVAIWTGVVALDVQVVAGVRGPVGQVADLRAV